jgi:hypothetical protein
MRLWFIVLIASLATGIVIGHSKFVTLLSSNLTSVEHQNNVVHMSGYDIVASAVSFMFVGATIWVAWLSTKRIGHNFRLAEDYGYKATLAKSYEGYKAEAETLDAVKPDYEFRMRVFSSLLSRLDEHPLRFVEHATHGSPWQELLSSKQVRKAITKFCDAPDTIEKFVKALARVMSSDAASGRTKKTDAP